jgi:hypothetical protein
MQSPLWPDPPPALDSYDLLLINISGGRVERVIGHSFKHDLSIGQIIAWEG